IDTVGHSVGLVKQGGARPTSREEGRPARRQGIPGWPRCESVWPGLETLCGRAATTPQSPGGATRWRLVCFFRLPSTFHCLGTTPPVRSQPVVQRTVPRARRHAGAPPPNTHHPPPPRRGRPLEIRTAPPPPTVPLRAAARASPPGRRAGRRRAGRTAPPCHGT